MNGFIAIRSVLNQNHGGLVFAVDPRAVIILPVGGFEYRALLIQISLSSPCELVSSDNKIT
jgi:hypothetical protein